MERVGGQATAAARSILNRDNQAKALAEVARALAAAGRHEDAGRVIGQAERVAGSITDPDDQAQALAEVAREHWLRPGGMDGAGKRPYRSPILTIRRELWRRLGGRWLRPGGMRTPGA